METRRTSRETGREMGFDVLEIGVQMRKLTRTCYRSVGNHPFLVGTLCFMILLYRSFPFVFSILVSASPVLVCTAVLLGTLLSLGQPNIPEIEIEEKKTHEIGALKAGVSEDPMVVRKDESFTVERYIGKGRDTVEKGNEEASEVSKVEKGDCWDDNTLLIDGTFREIQCEKRVIEEVERESPDLEFEHKMEINEKLRNESGYAYAEVVGNQYSLIPKGKDEIFEVKNDKSPGEFIDAHIGGCLDSSLDLSWEKRQEEEEEDEDENDDESSDSGSDGAESSSPDASMADIIPMLDELHPLLDSEAPLPACMSHDDSDAASERSQKCNNCSVESDEDTENQEEEGEDDNDDDEEEEPQGDKADGNKSAITWTEDDQKNLMDLGTSELERNQRLENLIARRRARKNFRLTAEKNLIDLESADLPFNITPILTTRRNPFDLPYDSCDNMGLPPIPGSAPSILLPRRNPFDLPYDSNEEKPNLMGDSFQQEFMTFHQRDTFFRRHESFTLEPLGFGGPKQEKQDIKWRPYFVPERLASEGTSYPLFQRQSSEASDSKVSSAPETESICSAADQEERQLIDHDISQKTEPISVIDHASGHAERSQSSEDINFVEIEQLVKRDAHHEEVEIKMGDLENYQEMEMSLAEAGGVASPVEFDESEIHPNTETVEKDNNRSSLSSLSEVDEEIVHVKKDEGLTSLEPKGDLVEESCISMQSSPEESNFNFTSCIVDDNQVKEPVYDSSPPAAENLLSFSSISSDLQVESSEMGSPPVSVQTNAPFADKESEVYNESIAKVTPGTEAMQAGSSQLRAVDKTELKMGEITASSELDVKFGSSGVGQNSDDPKGSLVPESLIEHVSIDSSSSSSDIQSVDEGIMYKEESFQHELDRVRSFSVGTEIHVGVHQDVGESLDSATSSYQYTPSEDLNLSVVEEQQPSLVAEQVSMVHPDLSSSKTETMEEHIVDQEETLRVEQDQVQSSSSDTKIHVDVHQVVDEKLVIMGSSYQVVHSEDKSLPCLEKQLSLSEKSMPEPYFDDHEEPPESSLTVVESIEEVSITNYLNVPEVHNPKDNEVPDFSPLAPPDCTTGSITNYLNVPEVHNPKDNDVPDFSPLAPPDCTSVSSEDPENQSPTGIDLKGNIFDGIENEERSRVLEPFNFSTEAFKSHAADRVVNEDADVIREIDEELLLELDTVGDFGVKEMGSNLNEFEKHLSAHAESLLVSRSEEAIEKPVVDSLNVELIPAKTEVGCSGFVLLCKDENLTETNLELPVLEARSFEDINLAFKQLHEGVDVEELIHEGVDIDDRQVVVESEDPVKIDSKLKIVEVRSLEDSHMALEQVSEGNLDQLPKPLEYEEKSVEVEANEVGSSMEIESSGAESHVQETSTSAAENRNHEVGETSEDSNLIKKAKPPKSRSSSSSSLSSSSSDSF